MSGQRHQKLPEILFEIGKVIGSADGLGGLLTQISRLVTELIGAQACSILLLDTDKQRLLGKAAYGLDRVDVEAISFRVGEGVAGWVVEHGESALIDDVAEDARFVTLEGSNHQIRSLLCVPLKTRDEQIGALTATSQLAAAFDPRDRELLEFVATTMALDVQNLRLRRLALTDSLTGAHNREYLQRELPAAIERAAASGNGLSVAMIDIDHFKSINDRFGHEVGDLVLAEVAERLRSAIRGGDVLVRYGGEEFLALLPGADLETAAHVGERIRERVADGAITVGEESGAVAQVRVSVGVAARAGDEGGRELVRRADAALYRAKERGRDRVVLADPPGL